MMFKLIEKNKILICPTFILILIHSCGTFAENFEFQVSNPILLTSLRNFVPTPDDSLYISKARNGSIILQADKGCGIMAVIQKMNLQDLNSQSKLTCFDYLKLFQMNGTKNSGEICGNSERNEFVQPSFVDKTGKTVLNYVLQEKIRFSPLEVNYTNFNISFTAFTECPEDAFPFGNEYLKPCSTVDPFSCIPLEYFCDGVVNCGFKDEFGLDERYCGKPKQKIRNSSKIRIISTESPLDSDKESIFLKGGYSKSIPYDPYQSNLPYSSEKKPLKFLSYFANEFQRWKYLGFGLFLFLVIFKTCATLVGISNHSEAQDQNNLVKLKNKFVVQRRKCDTSSSVHLISNEFDEEDPVPSYEKCVLTSLTLPILEIENEGAPLHKEVKVHL